MNLSNLRSTTYNQSQELSQDLSPSTKKRINNAFITQIEKNISANENQIAQNHQELNHYIDILDKKVQQKVEDNEAEILIAYKNHLVKIRKEMEEFKNETLAAANSSVSHEQKIEQLEKQLIIFRDESLRLFEKIVAKDNMIEELQAKVEELTVENRHLCDSYKLMSRRNRELEMIKYKLNLKTEKETLGEQGLNKIDLNYFTSIGVNQKYSIKKGQEVKTRPRTSSINHYFKSVTQTTSNIGKLKTTSYSKETMTNLEMICKNIRLKLEMIGQEILDKVIQTVEQSYLEVEKSIKVNYPTQAHRDKDHLLENKRTRLSMRSRSNYTHFEEQINQIENKKQMIKRRSVSHSKNQEMLDYFKSCVETVKKQIARRKNINSINYFKEGSPLSIQEFKKIDFFRLLQLVFANETIIQKVYELIFFQSQ